MYEMLEEYGTHLVEAAWAHQISLLLPTIEGWSPEIRYAVIWDHQSEIEHVDVAFLWMTVLWQRGFDHGNPQVIFGVGLDETWKHWSTCSTVVFFGSIYASTE